MGSTNIVDLIISGLVTALNAALQSIAKFLITTMTVPPMLKAGSWQGVLYGGSWGYAQLIAVASTSVVIVVGALLTRRMKLVVQAVGVAFLVVFVGGKFFDLFAWISSMSASATIWILHLGDDPNNAIQVFSNVSADTAIVQLIAIAASGYYGIIITVVFYVLALVTVVFNVLFMPLIVLMPWFGWAKWAFDWLLTAGIIALGIGAPLIAGIIKLGLFANQLLGADNQALGATIALVASLAVARKVLIKAISGAHRYIAGKTSDVQAAVRGRVETDWRRRPQVDVHRVNQQYGKSIPPAQANQPASSTPRRVVHAVQAAGIAKVTATIASKTHPVATLVAVPALKVLEAQQKRKAGL